MRAFVFPGQGSQYVGMGKELAETHEAARRVFERADEALGESLSGLCFEGPEEALKLTANTQPAILTTSLACLAVLEEAGQRPDLVAGHSLGEYSALVAAKSLELEDAVRTVRTRGRLMQEAVPEGEGAMAALLGLPSEELEPLLAEAAQGETLQAANFNSPEQVVIAGTRAAVTRALEQAKGRGAKRAVELPVSAPFHCALMEPAAEKLTPVLGELSFRDLAVPLCTNVDAELIESGDQARDALRRQVASAVRWEESVKQLYARGARTFVEVGPGRVLSGLVRRILPRGAGVTLLNVENEMSLAKVLEAL